MKPAIYPAFFLVATVTLLIQAELRGNKRRIYFFKPLSTLLVIICALLSFLAPVHNTTYSVGVLIGLLLSLAGDVLLMFTSEKFFLMGLVSFLSAHVVYTVVFTLLNGFYSADVLSALVLLALMVILYQPVKPQLGKMKWPVIAYALVISVMVNRAFSTLWGTAFNTSQAWMVVGGAILFFISDIMLAANRFWKPWKYNRFSLAFYYAGQFLLALSCSYFN